MPTSRKEYHKLYMRMWRRNNPGKVSAIEKRSRKNHPESQRLWRANHPNYYRQWYIKHADKLRKKSRQWAAHHRAAAQHSKVLRWLCGGKTQWRRLPGSHSRELLHHAPRLLGSGRTDTRCASGGDSANVVGKSTSVSGAWTETARYRIARSFRPQGPFRAAILGRR